MEDFTVNAILNRSVYRYPNKVALIFENERYTFHQLNERINGLINGLASLGIKKGDRVAIYSHNHARYVEALYAAARGGFILCTVNALFKEKELVHVLQDSGSKAIIYHSQYSDLMDKVFPQCNALNHKICFDNPPQGVIDYDQLVDSSSKAAPNIPIAPDDILILMYTSGTTGRPKGVMLSQYNVFMNTTDTVAGLGFEPNIKTLCVLPLFHVGGAVAQMFSTLCAGGTMVIIPRFDPENWLRTIEKERITSSYAVPTMLFRILDLPDIENYDVSSLKWLGYGAAPITGERLKKAIEIFGRVLYQAYGMTESTGNITILRGEDHKLKGSEAELNRLKSCGREFSNNNIRVVNPEGESVKPGEVGEITYKGPGIMKGYWNNPEATSNAIVNGWLHTGDMATVDEDNYIYIVDRKNDMIISGGENIYPKEVENVLFSHPAIFEAGVVGVTHQEWGEVPKAFVVLRPGASATEEEIIAYCKKNLSSYKCPKSVLFIDEVPKTASGKITRAGLREKYLK